ncbi:MAG: hypothetical protein ABIP78_12675, partial [Pyrinomonadaceae bacterium]
MRLAVKKLLYIICFVLAFSHTSDSQDLTHELNIAVGGTVEIVNKYGRISVKAEPSVADKPVASKISATSQKGVSEGEIKITTVDGRTVVIVNPTDKRKRIDLIVTLPERSTVRIETVTGAIEMVGNFVLAEAKTDTGTIVTDVPAEDLTYQFLWTESRPRYLADFDIAKVKEKNAGRFEVKGRRRGEVKSEKIQVINEETILEANVQSSTSKEAKTKNPIPKSVSLNFTTARGIILLNVPPNEVMSDLRERPLTDAAKAIVRSGDSLLMEA